MLHPPASYTVQVSGIRLYLLHGEEVVNPCKTVHHFYFTGIKIYQSVFVLSEYITSQTYGMFECCKVMLFDRSNTRRALVKGKKIKNVHTRSRLWLCGVFEVLLQQSLVHNGAQALLPPFALPLFFLSAQHAFICTLCSGEPLSPVTHSRLPARL